MSAATGHLLGEYAPTVAIVFAGLIFGYLAMDELISWKRAGSTSASAASATASSGGSSTSNSTSSTLTIKTAADGNNNTTISDTIRIAIPMTLNNLAGGAAGGAAGINAKIAGIMALLASYCMMKLGHVFGLFLMKSVSSSSRKKNDGNGTLFDTRVVSGLIFALLALMQLIQLVDMS